MKKILFLTAVITLLTTSGCLVSEGHRHGHSRGPAHYESHAEVILPAPVIVVPVVGIHVD